MLSELIFASVGTKRKEVGDRVPGISISALFPCAYRMYKVHLGQIWAEEQTPQQLLNMSDGWDQEQQAVERLEHAGVKVKNRQARVTVGKSDIPGRPDGIVNLKGEEYLWEFKAMNSERYSTFTRWGLDAFPGYRAQDNGYLLGLGLGKVCHQAKHKDSNNYRDIVESLDKNFILPIVEACDKIRIEGWIPEPIKSKYCTYCGLDCFGKALDLSWMDTVDELEMAQRWITGKKHKDVGEMLMEEARSYFVGIKDKYGNWIKKGLIGDKELLTASGVEIRKIIQHRFDVKRERVLEVFGAEGLMKVSEESEVTQYRIKEL